MPRDSTSWASALAILLTAGCATTGPKPGEPTPVSQACLTIGRADAHSVLLKRDNILSVAPLSERPFVASRNPLVKARSEQRAKTIGVRLVVKPAPGLTGEWLQTLANCDRKLPPEEHAVAIQCPFELANSSANVVSLGDAFAIDVTSNDPAIVEEATRRAEALAAQ